MLIEQFSDFQFQSTMFGNHINYVGLSLASTYTTKMFFGFEKLIERRYFQRKSKVLLIHTGGIYGNLGFNYLYDLDLPYESN